MDIFYLNFFVLNLGNMTKDFMPVGKEEQAELKEETNSRKVATLLGIDPEWMITYFCKPKLKVGTEWVTKGQTCPQAANSVAGKCFNICNATFLLDFTTAILAFKVSLVLFTNASSASSWTNVTKPSSILR